MFKNNIAVFILMLVLLCLLSALFYILFLMNPYKIVVDYNVGGEWNISYFTDETGWNSLEGLKQDTVSDGNIIVSKTTLYFKKKEDAVKLATKFKTYKILRSFGDSVDDRYKRLNHNLDSLIYDK